MTLSRKLMGLGIVFVAAAVMFGSFTASASAQTPTPTPAAAPVATPVAPAAPAAAAPAKTGNAGLLGTSGTSMALVLMLGIAAAGLVAGARTATRGR